METKPRKSRHGVHDETLVGFSGYITPELKAIAQVAANEKRTTMMDLVRDGIMYHATQLGIVRNGKVTDKYAPVVAAYVDVYNARKANSRKQKGEE